MGRYFGTDGFRGEANMNLTADHAYKEDVPFPKKQTQKSLKKQNKS